MILKTYASLQKVSESAVIESKSVVDGQGRGRQGRGEDYKMARGIFWGVMAMFTTLIVRILL